MTPVPTALSVAAAVGVVMLLELRLSRRHERLLRARGAVEPADDVFPLMRVAYPLGFAIIACEGALHDVVARDRLLWGTVVFLAAKALKYWAIVSLGPLWSFRVLVLDGEPLVQTGPYRYLRHPNYVALAGEFIGVALMLSAPVTGATALIAFCWLMWRRIQVEERALGLRPSSRTPHA
jgi:methyltransferase